MADEDARARISNFLTTYGYYVKAIEEMRQTARKSLRELGPHLSFSGLSEEEAYDILFDVMKTCRAVDPDTASVILSKRKGKENTAEGSNNDTATGRWPSAGRLRSRPSVSGILGYEQDKGGKISFGLTTNFERFPVMHDKLQRINRRICKQVGQICQLEINE